MCSESHGKLTVFSVKAMLSTMCGGKIVDKLRCKYISARLNDSNPHKPHLSRLTLLMFCHLLFILAKLFLEQRPSGSSAK